MCMKNIEMGSLHVMHSAIQEKTIQVFTMVVLRKASSSLKILYSAFHILHESVYEKEK